MSAVGSDKFLCVYIVYTHIYTVNILQLKVREKPKGVRSLRQCAPLWPIAELKTFLCLTRSLLLHYTTQAYKELIPKQFLGHSGAQAAHHFCFSCTFNCNKVYMCSKVNK